MKQLRVGNAKVKSRKVRMNISRVWKFNMAHSKVGNLNTAYSRIGKLNMAHSRIGKLKIQEQDNSTCHVKE